MKIVDEQPTDETALLERAKSGDVAAWEEIVRRYQDVVLRTAWLITGSRADADDAAQEAFIKAWLAIDRFRSGSPFRPWILRIAGNEARNRRRSDSRRERLASRVNRATLTVTTEPSAEDIAVAQDTRRVVLAAVDDLNDDERLVVVCRYMLGLSEAETAELAGCPKGTVKSRLSRALRRLREQMTSPDGRDSLESTHDAVVNRHER
ncbi:MAG: RNA polymerase sigma factor [Thermomicrobiales bacterium]|nr:RNA polymerase sigma factor [Thermomicrobiales bacterium]